MRALLVLALVVLVVTGCGRRGSPELPESARAEERVPLNPAIPDGRTVPNREFPLDPLVE